MIEKCFGNISEMFKKWGPLGKSISTPMFFLMSMSVWFYNRQSISTSKEHVREGCRYLCVDDGREDHKQPWIPTPIVKPSCKGPLPSHGVDAGTIRAVGRRKPVSSAICSHNLDRILDACPA